MGARIRMGPLPAMRAPITTKSGERPEPAAAGHAPPNASRRRDPGDRQHCRRYIDASPRGRGTNGSRPASRRQPWAPTSTTPATHTSLRSCRSVHETSALLRRLAAVSASAMLAKTRKRLGTAPRPAHEHQGDERQHRERLDRVDDVTGDRSLPLRAVERVADRPRSQDGRAVHAAAVCAAPGSGAHVCANGEHARGCPPRRREGRTAAAGCRRHAGSGRACPTRRAAGRSNRARSRPRRGSARGCPTRRVPAGTVTARRYQA